VCLAQRTAAALTVTSGRRSLHPDKQQAVECLPAAVAGRGAARARIARDGLAGLPGERRFIGPACKKGPRARAEAVRLAGAPRSSSRWREIRKGWEPEGPRRAAARGAARTARSRSRSDAPSPCHPHPLLLALRADGLSLSKVGPEGGRGGGVCLWLFMGGCVPAAHRGYPHTASRARW